MTEIGSLEAELQKARVEAARLQENGRLRRENGRLRAWPDPPQIDARIAWQLRLPDAILATDRYASEGFDYARLDTLLLALPVSTVSN